MSVNANKVGDVIGQELDIEFAGELNRNVRDDDEGHMLHDEDEDGDVEAEVEGINMNHDAVDPADVDLQDAGEDDDEEGAELDENRELNRQTDNLADMQEQYMERQRQQ